MVDFESELCMETVFNSNLNSKTMSLELRYFFLARGETHITSNRGMKKVLPATAERLWFHYGLKLEKMYNPQKQSMV